LARALSGEPTAFDPISPTAAGRYRFLCTPQIGADGTVDGLQLLVLDRRRGRASTRPGRQVEATLKLRERQLEEVQRLGRIGHWQWDVETGDFWASAELYRMYGFEPGSRLDLQRITEPIHPDDWARARDNRERAQTWEDKIKVGFVNRAVLDGMLRVSVEHDRRRGSEFDPYPYAPYVSSSFGPQPTTVGTDMRTWLLGVAQLQKFDVADRDQSIVNARLNHLFNPGLEGAVTLQWKGAEYPAEVGRSELQQSSIAFDFDYKAGPNLVLYGFYAYQAGSTEQRGVQSSACVMGQTYYFYSNGQVLVPATIGGPAPAAPPGATLESTQTVTTSNWQSVCGSTSATSPLFPDSRGWDVRSKDRNDTFGVGVRYDFGRAKLDANFTRSLARTSIGYSYNPTALGTPADQQALAGDGFSDLRFAQNVFSLSIVVPIDQRMSLRFFERYESGAVRDWHYDGVAQNPMPAASSVYLDSGAQDYSVNVVGVLLLIRI